MSATALVFSHILAFSVFFIDSLFDLFNNKDIPDEFAVLGVIGGILLHGIYSYTAGSLQPIIWSLGIGAIFSAYGWFAYWKGMWGGADAFLMSVLGFSVAGPITGNFNITYILDLMFNFMIATSAITVIYSTYKFGSQGGKVSDIFDKILEDEKKVSIGIIITAILSAMLIQQGINSFIFFGSITGLIMLYEFLQLIEEKYMVSTVKKKDLQGGEVPAPDQGLGNKIKGLTEEEIEEIESEEIKVRDGVPFIPVFLFTLLLTDLTNSGIWILLSIY